jgi:hypothetical protein
MPRLKARILFAVLTLFLVASAVQAALPGGDRLWYQADAAEPDERAVRLYVFWSIRCPHCTAAMPFIEDLALHYPWLRLESHEIFEHPENRARFRAMAAMLNTEASSVPTFMWCGESWAGYGEPSTTGRFLEEGLRECYTTVYGEAPPEPPFVAPTPETPPDPLPLPGGIDANSLSLPALTFVMAGMDAFNPCAFFILLVLLGLLVHARNRRLMLLVGGVFVFFSGFIYFLFMAAWLNAFRWIGGIQAVTVAAGAITLALGVINIKDFFWYKRGVSLSLNDGSRHKLIARMRPLLRGDNIAALLVGTVVLAIAANSYELLCTLGFPMAYTRILTLNELPTAQYYLYLLLYNVVYVIPLFVIVVVFTITLGSRKLGESEGRALKLMSGMMLLGLGMLLLLAPEALINPLIAVALLLTALLATALAVYWDRRRRG